MRIQASEIQEALKQGLNWVLIDVRTPVEYEEKRIAGSRSMPLSEIDPKVLSEIKRDSGRCVLLCLSGKRSNQAYEQCREVLGEEFDVLEGGIESWEAAGFPLERATKSRISLMRQVQIVIGLSVAVSAALAMTVDLRFLWVPFLMGCGLTFAGLTGWCGLALLLAKMPWNRVEARACTGNSCCL